MAGEREGGRDVRARVKGILQLPLCRIHRTVARNATLDFAFVSLLRKFSDLGAVGGCDSGSVEDGRPSVGIVMLGLLIAASLTEEGGLWTSAGTTRSSADSG